MVSSQYYDYTGDSFEDNCCLSEAAIRLRDCFRLLWSQHVYWTRMVILGIAFDLPDLEPTTNRLLRNPKDFGIVLCRFYGYKFACEFARLMTEHLTIAAELVKAAKAGDESAAADAEKRWYENAKEIACLQNHINPYWPFSRMKELWFEHLSLTKEEAVTQLTGDYTASIKKFNQIEKEAMMMADAFSNGIICQFNL